MEPMYKPPSRVPWLGAIAKKLGVATGVSQVMRNTTPWTQVTEEILIAAEAQQRLDAQLAETQRLARIEEKRKRLEFMKYAETLHPGINAEFDRHWQVARQFTEET